MKKNDFLKKLKAGWKNLSVFGKLLIWFMVACGVVFVVGMTIYCISGNTTIGHIGLIIGVSGLGAVVLVAIVLFFYFESLR